MTDVLVPHLAERWNGCPTVGEYLVVGYDPLALGHSSMCCWSLLLVGQTPAMSCHVWMLPRHHNTQREMLPALEQPFWWNITLGRNSSVDTIILGICQCLNCEDFLIWEPSLSHLVCCHLCLQSFLQNLTDPLLSAGHMPLYSVPALFAVVKFDLKS